MIPGLMLVAVSAHVATAVTEVYREMISGASTLLAVITLPFDSAKCCQRRRDTILSMGRRNQAFPRKKVNIEWSHHPP